MRCPNRWLLTIGLVTLGQQPLAQAHPSAIANVSGRRQSSPTKLRGKL